QPPLDHPPVADDHIPEMMEKPWCAGGVVPLDIESVGAIDQVRRPCANDHGVETKKFGQSVGEVDEAKERPNQHERGAVASYENCAFSFRLHGVSPFHQAHGKRW